MSDGSQFIDIVIFAMIAIFLGLRLRSVLGKRTGNEPKSGSFRGGFPPARDDSSARNNVIELEPNRPRSPAGDSASGSLSGGVAAIRDRDPTFSLEYFKAGAGAAFEMIVRAFANDDESTLRPLLADDVFENFVQVIRARKEAGNRCLNQLVRINSVDIVDAHLDGTIARVTVKYSTLQIIVTKNAEDAVIEGDPARQVDIIDVWSFARDTRSRDPNWLLVATSSPEG